MTRLDAVRGHPPRRPRPRGAARGDGPTTASTPRSSTRRPASSQARRSPTRTPTSTRRWCAAYNDWLSEYVAYAPDALRRPRARSRTAASTARSRRSSGCTTVPASAACVMGCYPNGTLERDARGRHGVGPPRRGRHAAVSIHVSLTQAMPSAHQVALPGYGRFFDAPNRIVELIFAGVFDRFPALQRRVRRGRLRLGARTSRSRSTTTTSASTAVSDFTIERARRASTSSATSTSRFITDPFGIAQPPRRSASSACSGRATTRTSAPTGRYSWRTIQAAMSGVPHDERELILAGNAVAPLRVLIRALGSVRCAGGCRRAARPWRPCRPTRGQLVDHDQPLGEPLVRHAALARGARPAVELERRCPAAARRRGTPVRRRPRRASTPRPRPRSPGGSATSASTAGALMFLPPRMMMSDVRPTTRR